MPKNELASPKNRNAVNDATSPKNRKGPKPPPDPQLSPKSAAKKADQYVKLERLGEGSFGTAYLVEKVDDVARKQFVLKEIRCHDKEQVIDALREMVAMRILQCPWVVRYEDYWMEELNVILIMEYCPGGDLYRKMNQALKKKTHLPEETIMKWFTQIALGLNEIHNRAFMHRDIKPSNVLLDAEGNAKLGDFGLTSNIGGVDINESFRGTICGTPGFLSPEIERGDKYNVKSDVWALACTLYEMLALRSVFQDTLDGIFPGPIPDVYSQKICDVLRAMLFPEMALRPHIQDVLKIPIVARQASKITGVPYEPKRSSENDSVPNESQNDSHSSDQALNLSAVLAQLKHFHIDAFHAPENTKIRSLLKKRRGYGIARNFLLTSHMVFLTAEDQVVASIIVNWLESRQLGDVASMLRSRLTSCMISTASDDTDPVRHMYSDEILAGIYSVVSRHVRPVEQPKKRLAQLRNGDTIDDFLRLSSTASVAAEFDKTQKIADMRPAANSNYEAGRLNQLALRQELPCGMNESFPPVAAIRNKSVHMFEDSCKDRIPNSRLLNRSDSLLTFGTTALVVDNVLHDQSTVDLEQFLDDLHQQS